MSIDVESIKQALSAFGAAITVLKQAKDLLPEKEKKEVGIALEHAERQLKIAESQSAQAMGYRLCRNHFPPEIMLSTDNENWRCPNCGNKISPKPHRPIVF